MRKILSINETKFHCKTNCQNSTSPFSSGGSFFDIEIKLLVVRQVGERFRHRKKNRSAMRTCGGLIISNLILLFCEFISTFNYLKAAIYCGK